MNPCISGISLKLGCLIIGTIQIAIAIFECLAYSLALISLGNYGDLKEIKKIEGTFVVPFVDLKNEKIRQSDVESTLTIIFSIALVGSVIYGLVGVLLIVATKKRDLRHFKAWLICQSILIMTGLLYMVVTLIFGSTTAISLVCDILSICVQFYFLWVVYSFAVKMKDEQTLTMSPSIRKSGDKIDVSFPFETFGNKS